VETIRISDETADRLKRLAKPIDDTWETLLARLGLFVTARETEFRSFDPNRNGAAVRDGAADAAWDQREAHQLARMAPAIREMYRSLRSAILAFGSDVEIGATQSYIRCSVNGRNFAEINPRSNGLAIFMRPEGFNIDKGATADVDNVTVERPANANWTLNALVRVTPKTDVNGLQGVLRRAYTATKHL
jgi:predicted transport protein/predicted transcriptional regulator